MRFVLTLHSHLPWVLNHGRWPHGSDWLCEAAVDTYLPLIATLDTLHHQKVPAPVTLGITPVLANQLAHPAFPAELDQFLAQRLEACDEAWETFRASGETRLRPLARHWRAHLERLRRTFEQIDRDIPRAFRRMARAGRLELMTSAATHGFLPLLACDESIRLQLETGRDEHRRLFGMDAVGCWVPECAYRPAGPWQPLPDAPVRGHRVGLEEHLAAAGLTWFFTDAHLAEAGEALGLYGEEGVIDGIREPGRARRRPEGPHSPLRPYRVLASDEAQVSVLVRDPRTSFRVWSRHQGYPGDGAYLEFHKIRWPGGLKFWRVTGTEVDLGGKLPYDQNVARARAWRDAADFTALLQGLAAGAGPGDEVVAAPFDTELFGHWWFEGVDFLGDLYRALARQTKVRPTTAGAAIQAASPGQLLRLAEGSWGANGDFSMWLNPGTEWTWRRLWPLEERFWTVARRRTGLADTDAILAQAARELLLAQSSDWQFIISTGAAADYAERRFAGHCDALAELLDALERGTPEALAEGRAAAARHEAADDLFPDILIPLRRVLAAVPAR